MCCNFKFCNQLVNLKAVSMEQTGGVMLSMLALRVVDREFEHRSGQTKGLQNCYLLFFH